VPMQNTPAGIALALQELIHKLDLSSSKVKERSATNSVVSSNGWGRKMIEVVEGEVHGG
jgi:hypothetical protein